MIVLLDPFTKIYRVPLRVTRISVKERDTCERILGSHDVCGITYICRKHSGCPERKLIAPDKEEPVGEISQMSYLK